MTCGSSSDYGLYFTVNFFYQPVTIQVPTLLQRFNQTGGAENGKFTLGTSYTELSSHLFF